MTHDPPPLEIRLCPAGIILGDDTVALPLHSARMDYFRLSKSAWRPALEAIKGLGVRLVDIVLPWSVHERARGDFDFGDDNPRLGVGGFLELCQDVGLYAAVRVGPVAGAELAFGGVPERVVWTEACQARSPGGAPVLVPALPVPYPLPSLASRTFHEEAAVWLGAVAEQLAERVWPGGPVVLAELSFDVASAFHVGPYDRDYHPDAIAQYRRFLIQRYGAAPALRRAHRNPAAAFDTVVPPGWLDGADPEALARHLDWCEFQDVLLEAALYRSRSAIDKRGLRGVPKAVAIPTGRRFRALDAPRLARTVDLVTLAAGRRSTDAARDVTELSLVSARRDTPTVGAVSAGFAANASPASDAEDAFSALTRLAYGLRGITLDMAVQRDRWIGGPIDARGHARPSSDFWKRLFDALTRTRFHGLERQTKVRLVVPRSLERLARVCQTLVHASPELLSGAFMASSGLLEGDLDPTRGALLEAEQFIATLERVLTAARVPYAFTGADALDSALEGGAWAIVICAGALDPTLTAAIADRVMKGARISVGPRAPERDEQWRECGTRLPTLAHPPVPLLLPRGPATLAELLETAMCELQLERLAASPDGIRTTLHVDAAGRPAVLFVLNDSKEATDATVAAPGSAVAIDALTGERFPIVNESVTVALPARTVRMLALE